MLSDTAHIGYKVISDDRRITVSNGMLLRQCNVIFFEKVSKCSNSKSNAIKTYPKIFCRPIGGRPPALQWPPEKKEEVSDKSVNGLEKGEYHFYSASLR